MTWEELVADVTARHPLHESKMFGMPCLKRENGKVVAGHWKDGGITVKLTDEAAREQALALPGRRAVRSGHGPRHEGVGARAGDAVRRLAPARGAGGLEWTSRSLSAPARAAGQGRPSRALAARDHVRSGSGVDPHFHKGHRTRSTSSRASSSSTSETRSSPPLRARTSSLRRTSSTTSGTVGDVPARVLNLHTPGGFARYRRELRELRAQGIEPDRAFFERHDVFDV